MDELITIDGKTGGGQVLRTSLGMSALTGKPIKVVNIRGSRPYGGGIKTQHLEGLKALAELCNAKAKGMEIGSKEVEFIPGRIEAKDLDVSIGTAGSIGLLFQSLQLPTAFAGRPIKISVHGGSTASAWSPPVQYFQNVFLPIVEKMGYSANIDVTREGFYPKGGAEVEINVKPIKKLSPIVLMKRAEVKAVRGISIAGCLPEHVADRQAKSAEKVLAAGGIEAHIDHRTVQSASPGTSITLWADCGNTIIGADAIGERGVPAEKVGTTAAKEFLESLKSRAALDKHMSDQIIPFMALAKGRSKIGVESITEHCRTNIEVTEKLLNVKFEVNEKDKAIAVNGMGYSK
jgi:RNA 3'-phosphate cyclase